jgi:hypothetical protein
MRTTLLAKLTPFFILAFFLGALLGAPQSASAQPQAVGTISTGEPTEDGEGTTYFSDFSGNSVYATVAVRKGETCFQKASDMAAAIQAEIAGDGLGNIFAVTYRAGERRFSVTNLLDCGLYDGVPWDSTETGTAGFVYCQKPPNRRYLWAFDIWLATDTTTIVPNGTVMTMTAQEPNGTGFSVTVTGNGVLTVAQLQQQAIAAFEALGITFTPVTNPATGASGYQSQYFVATQAEGEGWVKWNATWSSYLGTAGVVSAPYKK